VALKAAGSCMPDQRRAYFSVPSSSAARPIKCSWDRAMSSTEAEAVAAAQAFAIERLGSWDRRVVSVERGNVEGTDCWLVHTVSSPAAGEPDWWFEIDGNLTYFIRASDRRCIGVQAGTARHLF
jgi:hypothetical protein